MIVYALKCAAGHRFDGWFRNGEDCDSQLARHLVACPSCGDSAVGKAPMAPRIAKGRRGGDAPPTEVPPPAGAPVSGPVEGQVGTPSAPVPASAVPPDGALPEGVTQGDVRRFLRELRRQVETNATYVGGGFAEEARKIHYGEAEGRPIYGETTPQEARDLQEEGVEFSAIPWLPLDN